MNEVINKPIQLNPAQQKLLKQLNSPFLMNLFMLTKLPAALFSGVRVVEVTPEYAKVKVPYKWFTKNPFRSTYFACLAMAGEMSTGLLAMLALEGIKPSISLLVIKFEAEYGKKAADVSTFTCTNGPDAFACVQQAIETGEAVAFESETVGHNKDGDEVARMKVTWSFKQRSK